MQNKAKSNTARIPWCKCDRYMRGKLSFLPGEVLRAGEEETELAVTTNRKKSADAIVPSQGGKGGTVAILGNERR